MAGDKRSGDNRAGKGPSLSGNLMIDTYRGKLRVRKWPEKRGYQGEKIAAINSKFADNHVLWRYAPPDLQIPWIEATSGTPYYPRDFFTSLNYGRCIWWYDPIFEKDLYTVSYMTDVSKALDTLGSTPGSILVRGDDYWAKLEPGAIGEVLTMIPDGSGKRPSWEPGGGGGGGAWSLVDSIVCDGSFSHWDVNGLASYTEFLVLGREVTLSGSSYRLVRVSTDDGANFYDQVGDYIVLNSQGSNTNSNNFGGSNSTASSRSIFAHIMANLSGGLPFSNSVNGSHLFVASTDTINAIQITTLGPNMATGELFLFAR